MRASWFLQLAASALIMPLSGCILFIDQNVCGDGDIDSFEECDNGADNSDTTPNACRTDCTLFRCGDGIVDDFEQCDGGANCDAFCNIVNQDVCGDGQVTGVEQCDNGDTIPGDGCDQFCNIEFCGDGVIQPAFENCDDGNTIAGDGCDDFCQAEVLTGDVTFEYVLLIPGAGGGIVAATSCNDPGLPAAIDQVHLMVGNKFLNNDGNLDDGEIIDEAFTQCNQIDTNNDGIIAANEFGIFLGQGMVAQSYDLFAIEFLDINGTPIVWQTFDVNTNFERFSFGDGVGFTVNAGTFIDFSGDANQVNTELQSFFGF